MHLLRHEAQPEHHNIANERKGVLECLPQRQLHFLCPLFMRGLLLRTGPANGLRDNSWALIGVRDTAGVIPHTTAAMPRCPQTRGSCSEQAVISCMPHHHADCGSLYKVCGALRTLATLVPVTVSVRAPNDPSAKFYNHAPTSTFTFLTLLTPSCRELIFTI